jgi:cell division protein FtsQ
MSLKETITDFSYKIYKFLRIGFFAGLLISVVVAYIYLHRPTTLSIQRVKIVGDYTYLDKSKLQDLITPYAQTGFFSVNLVALQQNLLQLPWLEAVQIRRIWPDTLIIILTGRTPIAYWGNDSLLDEKAIVFRPEKKFDLPSNLPRFFAADYNSGIVLQTYFAMNKIVDPLKLFIVTIQLNERQSWVLTLNNDIVLYLGRDKLIERLERFVNTYAQTINDKSNKVVSVDLRYDNGLAITWKK